ncbi:MAG TPA: SH3 domain-containing protein [Thermomicrobiales bacterium]|nr:SH3 domain-containing protein [Thermomicrobiales bacterium]
MTFTDRSTTRRDSSLTMTRRSAIRAVGGGAAALLTVATVGVAGANHTSQLYTVSANANFRIGPGTNYAIIAVITKGSTFTLNEQTQNGYAGIISNGRSGWVLASLVVAAGSTGTTPVISGSAWTADYVNLRSGPGTSYQVLRVVPKGSQIGTSTTVKNGFRYVSHNGLAGWMADSLISATNPDDQGTNYKTATVNLNLRAEPSTSAKVLTVIPAGAKVQLLHTQVGQYGNANYNGMQGWVAPAYLK